MRAAAVAVAVLLGGCAAPVIAPASIALRNADFEAPMGPERRCAEGWDCTVHADPHAFRFFAAPGAAPGSQSLCVERVTNEPWAVVRQLARVEALRGMRVRLSVAVRVEGTRGEGAGPWLMVEGNRTLHEQRLVNTSSAWERIAVEMAVPTDAGQVVVGATLLGPGKACFDDVRLEILEPVTRPSRP